MQHYWGAQAICERIGYRSSQRLPDLIRALHIPAYKRHHPLKKMVMTYYSNESMLSRWEMSRAQDCHDQLIADREKKQLAAEEKKKYGPRGLKK